MKKILFLVLAFSFADVLSLGKKEKIAIEGFDGRKGFYNPDNQTASLSAMGDDTMYTNVVEYSQAVTPPTFPSEAFATIPNPKYTASGPRMGGQKRTITLYGIPQYSTEVSEMPSEILGSRSVGTQLEKTFEIYGSKGNYNVDAKTAYLVDAQGKKKEYTNVVEYSQAVTPPNIGNSALKRFATMPNPKYKKSDKRIAGGQFKDIVLYGIEKRSDDVSKDFKIESLENNF